MSWYDPWPGDARRWLDFWRPELQLPASLNPIVALTSLLALILTTGFAVASLAVLLASLLALYLLLSEVFGIRFELAAA